MGKKAKKDELQIDKKDVFAIASIVLSIFSIYCGINAWQGFHQKNCENGGCGAVFLFATSALFLQAFFIILATCFGFVGLSKNKKHKVRWLPILGLILAVISLLGFIQIRFWPS